MRRRCSTATSALAPPLQRVAPAATHCPRARLSVSSANLTLDWAAIGLPADQPARLRDVWARADLGVHTANFTVRVPPHGVALLRASQQPGAH